MSLMDVASRLFLDNLSSSAPEPSTGSVQEALRGLLPTSGGELDLAALVGLFTQQGGLASLASSWLGDGGNMELSAQSLLSVFGESSVAEFAGHLGLETGTAAQGLSDMLPKLIDKASSGGSLQKNLGASLVSGLAGKLFS